MLKRLAMVVVVLLVALLVFAATRPDAFRVERTATINAPPEKIFPLIADFHEWGAWSPYEKLDPAMQRTFGGAAQGKGAVYEWNGNKTVGQGRMEITDAPAASRVVIKLDFIRPFASSNTAEFVLEPRGGSTDVTWAMHGPNTYMGKLMDVFVDMDDMIGKDFTAGLANLKAVAER
jgi:uncharacterized protein YndB with AHSA1/START domain